MDPITVAIVAALGKLGENVIKDAYDALKVAIAHKCGVNSNVVEAIENLEKKPDSAGRKETLKEEIVTSKIDKDTDILNVAQVLLDKIDELEDQASGPIIIKQQAGDNAIQIGQVSRDVNIENKN
jgi:hypothetical protein